MATYKSEIEIINQSLAVLNASTNISTRYKAKIELFEERRKRAMQNTYRMGVIGVTSSGKSTLINSLLNEDLLPSAVIPSSSQLVSCRKGDDRYGVVYFEDKKPQKLSSLNLTSQTIKKYGEEQSNPRNRLKVKQIEIFTHKFPFDKDLILVDSPGLDAYGFEGHEQLTLNTLLPSVDFCLFITTCKTNSDSKTKSVLNTIAQYDKPVVIIQNMIDSIKPSLDIDGTIRKTEIEVADEHRKRVQKIVDESQIKSKVVILQYSAIWARNGQIGHDHDLLKKSGYNELISIIKDTFCHLKPKAENKRINFLKQELDKIISEAQKDGEKSNVPIGDFEFEGAISNIKDDIKKHINEIQNHLSKLIDAANNIRSQYSVSEYDKIEAKNNCTSCSSDISSVQKKVFSIVEDLCNRLHLSTTDVFNEQCYFPPVSSVPTIHTTKTVWYERKKKDGLLNLFKRFFGRCTNNDDLGYENIKHEEEVVNVEASKDSIYNYLKSAFELYSSAITKWISKVDNAIDRLQIEIEKLRMEHINREEKALESKVYLDVADELKSIVNNISVLNEQSFSISSTKTNHEQIEKKEIPKLAYDLSKLAYVVSDKIHKMTFEKEVPQNGNPENIIIGWDSLCLQNFIKRSVGKEMYDIQDKSFFVGRQSFRVFYNPDMGTITRNLSYYCNVFILINALQHGHALSQLANCHLNKFIRKSDNLYIVVQDFQEIVNAQVINDALTSLKSIEYKIELKTRPTFLIMHSNPVYNLAALETQHRKQNGNPIVQNDELTILNSLRQSSFGFLCSSSSESKIIISIIQSLK